VTALLRQDSIKVEELETRIGSAPFTGTPLFMLEGVVTLPQGTSARKMREALGALGCDIDLEPI
jgi:glycine cleavage system transcriptional repressor